MPSFTNIVPTTELEAVNAMLSAIGEAPITNVDTATQADATMAKNILRNALREVQSMGWRFNTEHGFRIKAEVSTYNWTDLDGVVTALNIFLPPTNMLGFTVTQVPSQQGSKMLDTVIRPSRKYTPGTLVFYDRILNRDGWAASDADRGSIYIDPVWGFDFEKTPESCRRYVAIRSARQFVQQAVGSKTLSSFSERDELLALRNLKREFGENDEYNMLQNTDVLAHLGGRPRYTGYVLIDPNRKSPG